MKFLLAAALTAASCATARTPAPTPAPRSPLATKLDAALDRYHRAGTFDGVVVVARGHEVVYAGAIGASLSPATLFPLASITKQVAALLAMQEVRAGTLTLDEPLSEALGEPLPAAARTVTVRQLLQHASGLAVPDDAFYRRATVGTAREEAAGCLAGELGPTGAFRYNNCDYVVLGAILERATHRTFAQLVHERVAAKLGLASWGVFGTDAQPVVVRGATDAPSNIATYGPAGAIYGTALDLSRWSRALLAHELLDPASTALMLTADPNLQMEALGSWAYDLDVAGRKVHLVERQGTVDGVNLLALASPSDNFTISIVATNANANLFDLWSKAGLPFDLVSIVSAR